MRVAFEVIEHPADVGFVAYGATLEELFGNAALALLTLACKLEAIAERERREIEATGGDLEALLFAWLAEILASADAEQLAFRRVEVTLLEASPDAQRTEGVAGAAHADAAVAPARIRGNAYGEPFDKKRHCAGTYIKAVTYHQLRVECTPEGWRAQVYLDV